MNELSKTIWRAKTAFTWYRRSKSKIFNRCRQIVMHDRLLNKQSPIREDRIFERLAALSRQKKQNSLGNSNG